MSGGNGNDLILGQADDDDRAGDNGRDNLDGGSGTNWGTIDAAGVETRCVYDRDPPVVEWATVSPDAVDVTRGDATATVRARLRDDTRVSDGTFRFYAEPGALTPGVGAALAEGPGSLHPHLVSGTPRNRIWEATVRAIRYSMPGDFTLNVDAPDRVNRSGSRDSPRARGDRVRAAAAVAAERLFGEPVRYAAASCARAESLGPCRS